MPEDTDDIQKLAPQKLLQEFSRGKVLMSILAAVVLHVVAIGGASTRYIYYTWINPEAAAALKAASETTSAAEQQETGSEEAEAAKPAGGETEEEMLEKRKDTRIVKEITAKATPDEIPDEPSGSAISIDDTNPR